MGDMRINLRRADVRMAEHHLHGAQVSPVFQQMRRERMPQRMRRNHLADARLLGAPFDDFPKSLPGQPLPPAVDKHRGRAVSVQQFGPSAVQVRLQAPDRGFADRDDAFFGPFAETAHEPHVQLQVGKVERQKLRHAHAGRVQQFQHRLVPRRLRRRVVGNVEQALHFFHRHRFRQPALPFGHPEQLGRVRVNFLFPVQKLEKRPNRHRCPGDGRRRFALLFQPHQVVRQMRFGHHSRVVHLTFLQKRHKLRQIPFIRFQRVAGQPPLRGEILHIGLQPFQHLSGTSDGIRSDRGNSTMRRQNPADPNLFAVPVKKFQPLRHRNSRSWSRFPVHFHRVPPRFAVRLARFDPIGKMAEQIGQHAAEQQKQHDIFQPVQPLPKRHDQANRPFRRCLPS